MKLSMRIVPAVFAALTILLAGCPGEECEPQTCSELGFECGVHDDGCGGEIDCGTCDNPPAAECDGNTAVNYEAVGTCTEGTCEYTDDREDCGSDTCVVQGTSAVCEPPAGTCDYEGFTAANQGAYVDADANLFELYADTSADAPTDLLLAEWWFDFGAQFTGPGVYPVETGVPYDECGLCVRLLRVNAAGQADQMFLATEGEIEVTAIGDDGEAVTAELRNAVFAEWQYDQDNDQAVADGEVWCIDSFNWDTTLDGQLP